MSCTVNVDIADDCPLGSFLSILELTGGSIKSFLSQGPGGGNPNVTVKFTSYEDAMAFLSEYLDGNLTYDEADSYIVAE